MGSVGHRVDSAYNIRAFGDSPRSELYIGHAVSIIFL